MIDKSLWIYKIFQIENYFHYAKRKRKWSKIFLKFEQHIFDEPGTNMESNTWHIYLFRNGHILFTWCLKNQLSEIMKKFFDTLYQFHKSCLLQQDERGLLNNCVWFCAIFFGSLNKYWNENIIFSANILSIHQNTFLEGLLVHMLHYFLPKWCDDFSTWKYFVSIIIKLAILKDKNSFYHTGIK